jgi:hypothetical protein
MMVLILMTSKHQNKNLLNCSKMPDTIYFEANHCIAAELLAASLYVEAVMTGYTIWHAKNIRCSKTLL